jgi:hypothetical protein
MKRPISRLLGIAVFAMALAVVIAGRASAPAGRYTIANGTVYDTKTGLTWQQAVSSSTYTQAAAASYCSSLSLNAVTWRLPTMKELLTIVDDSVASPGPTIDSTAFPATPAIAFWSSTPWPLGSILVALGVDFSDGATDDLDRSTTNYVRCVH